jgi:hypothetical protein
MGLQHVWVEYDQGKYVRADAVTSIAYEGLDHLALGVTGWERPWSIDLRVAPESFPKSWTPVKRTEFEQRHNAARLSSQLVSEIMDAAENSGAKQVRLVVDEQKALAVWEAFSVHAVETGDRPSFWNLFTG